MTESCMGLPVFGSWPQVAEASRKVLKTRYELLPYLYTLLYYAHVNGDAVFAPLWLNFWTDPVTYDITEQFMRSEEHTSELQSLMRISYAVFCLKKKKTKHTTHTC